MTERFPHSSSLSDPAMDWPCPSTILNADGPSDWVVICEHASCYMPPEYDGLGLPENLRRAHVAWDPGAAELTRALSARLNAAAVLANYSRLLIDLNRPVESPAAIRTRSEVIDVPGNAALSDAERTRRIARIHTPFHAAISDLLDKRADRRTRIVTVHSFTPVYEGEPRPWHLGILSDASHPLAQRLSDEVSRLQPGLNVALDVPYEVERGDDYAIPFHGDDRGNDALLLELRNDTLNAPAAVEAWADTLAQALSNL